MVFLVCVWAHEKFTCLVRKWCEVVWTCATYFYKIKMVVYIKPKFSIQGQHQGIEYLKLTLQYTTTSPSSNKYWYDNYTKIFQSVVTLIRFSASRVDFVPMVILAWNQICLWLCHVIWGVSENRQNGSHEKFMSNPNYKFSPLKLSSLSPMHFFILLCHTFMHSWKYSTEILCCSLLMASTSQKWGLLKTPLSLGKRQKKISHGLEWLGREDSAACWCSSSWQETVGCLEHCKLAHCHDEAAMSCLVTTLASCLLNEVKTAGSLCSHTGWSSAPVKQPPNPYSNHSSHSTPGPVFLPWYNL